jgi:hypothetical protein
MSGTLRVTGDVGLLIEHSAVLNGFSSLFGGGESSGAAASLEADQDHA